MSLFSLSRRRAARRAPLRLEVEALEDRCTPSTVGIMSVVDPNPPPNPTTPPTPSLTTPPTPSPSVSPNLSIGDSSVVRNSSGHTYAVFTLTLSAPSSQQITVQYATADGTAKAGVDYM